MSPISGGSAPPLSRTAAADRCSLVSRSHLHLFLSAEFLGAVLFVFAAGFPPFDDATEVDLTAHMVQHFVIVFSGALIAYPRLGRAMMKVERRRWGAKVALAVAAVVVVLWHLPGPWDTAVLNPAVHFFEHFSFLAVGLVAGSWLMLLSDSWKIGALLAAFFGHMGYAVVLIAPWGYQVYSLYPLQNQMTLGWALLLTGPALLAGVAYVVARNADWLAGFSGSRPPEAGRRETFVNRARVPRWVSPAVSFLLVAVLVGYFAATAYAVGTAGPAPGGSVVYIAETPVTWQYSPQTVRVVLGVNASVTWVSHSIAYDTVTSRDGSFGSGVIAPGGTFTHTFTEPGVYDYYCQYHPWMTGTVIVLAKG